MCLCLFGRDVELCISVLCILMDGFLSVNG